MQADRVENIGALLMKHRRALYAYIFSIVRSHHLAEDIVQDVAVVLVKRAQELDQIANFWGFTREIARRLCLAALRKEKKSELCLSPEALEALDIGFDNLQDEVEDRVHALRECVEELPASWRRVVNLRYWRRMSVGEVAENLKKSMNTVSVTLYRIHMKLAACVRRKVKAEVAA